MPHVTNVEPSWYLPNGKSTTRTTVDHSTWESRFRGTDLQCRDNDDLIGGRS